MAIEQSVVGHLLDQPGILDHARRVRPPVRILAIAIADDDGKLAERRPAAPLGVDVDLDRPVARERTRTRPGQRYTRTPTPAAAIAEPQNSLPGWQGEAGGNPRAEGHARQNSSALFFSSRRRHTRFDCDWSSDVCSSDLRRLLASPMNEAWTNSPQDISEILDRWRGSKAQAVAYTVSHGVLILRLYPSQPSS